MAIHAYQPGQKTRPAEGVADVRRVIAPIRGMDARVAQVEGRREYCTFTYNMVPYEYGMQMRKGYREWQIGIDDGALLTVRTIMPFDGIEAQGAQDRLFAVTNEGIWDVTTQGGTPVLKFTFTDQGAESGYGPFAHYVEDSGLGVLFYADSKNGLFRYDPATDAWAQATGINGPVVSDIRFVVTHKQRIWLVEEDSTDAWYLPIGSNNGQATKFSFGSKFRHGGVLQGLFNWSVDGGNGIDDMLVAVSRAGDVLPYQGSDPSSATTWQLVGTYYVGSIPKGPFFATEHGGELMILSEYGITSMNDLLKGVNSSISVAEVGLNAAAAKIASVLRIEMAKTLDQAGWQIKMIPSEGAMLVASPQVGTQPRIQYYYNYATAAWGLWRGVPIEFFDSWKGSVVFGDAEGRVLYMDVPVDNLQLTPPVGRINGDAIEFSILTSFQDYDAPGRVKHVQLVRPDFLSAGEPTSFIQVRYDYDIEESRIPISPAQIEDAIWDEAVWGAAKWSDGRQRNFSKHIGGWGYGRYVAIAMRGQAREETRLMGWDVIYFTGGGVGGGVL